MFIIMFVYYFMFVYYLCLFIAVYYRFKPSNDFISEVFVVKLIKD